MINFEYPLQWPIQQPRTETRLYGRFGRHSMAKAGNYLMDELRRLKAKDVIITSNLQTKARGEGFLSNQRVDDTGIAVYFKLKDQPKVMACDRYRQVEHNLWALFLSIQAIRGLERWGGSELLDGLFRGFTALPSPESVVIGFPRYFDDCSDLESAKERYKRLAKELHPDVGGDSAEFSEMKRQYEEVKGTWEG